MRKGSLERKAVYWHYPHYHPGGTSPAGAIRCGDWKLIEYFEDGHVELYNLKDDMSETTDLASKLPDKAAELKKMLADWRKSVGAQCLLRTQTMILRRLASEDSGSFV